MRPFLFLFLSIPALAGWISLTNGKNLDGWDVIGDGLWTVMRDGTILGQRSMEKGKAVVNSI